MNTNSDINRLVQHIKGKKVLLLTTSNRWEGSKEMPKSSKLAEMIQEELGSNCDIIDVSKLDIHPCEGNVSTEKGNSCGLKESILKDKEKNPSGCHRCWASINNPDDELWKVSKPLLEADAIIFLGSIRWGSMNAVYQKLIERLNWLENRWTTLGEDNILEGKLAGIVITGHNWNGEAEMEKQKQVLKFYGFDVPNEISFHWQWTDNAKDESAEGYIEDPKDFKEENKKVSAKTTESIKTKQTMKHIKLYEDFTNEAIDTKYWADYNTDTSGQGDKRFADKSKNFDDTFDYAVEDWNEEADGAENKIKDSKITKIQKLAKEFFKKEGWISVNVIQAMISQES